MSYKQILTLMSCALLLSACNSISSSSESKLYGAWDCKVDVQRDDVDLSLDYRVHYLEDGVAKGFGVLTFKTAKIPEVQYALKDTSDWVVVDDYLIRTTIDVEFANESYPDIDKVVNLEKVFPKDTSRIYKIITLSDDFFKYQSESDKTTYSCTKQT